MLADNILFLRERYPDVYLAVKTWEETKQEPKTFVEAAKDGHLTLKYSSGDKSVYIHSKYNPIREAEAIIDKLSKDQVINEHSHVVFYGIGLGYHIESFITRYPMTSYSIVEPSPEIFARYLDHTNLAKNLNKNLILLQCGNQADDISARAVQLREKNLLICEISAYHQVFHADYTAFFKEFKRIIKEQRASLHTNYAYKKRWIINSVNNFKVVLQTPNVLLENHDFSKGKSALLVAAGPSLDLEIENLKKIKTEGLAYIFSVGSAINTLIAHDIEPDAVCTYDPSEDNKLVFRKVNEIGLKEIPMIFGSSVDWETLEQYQGPKLHMITSQDTVSSYFLRSENGEHLETVSDAPTISVVTLELLIKLGFSQIFLVGQNLAYTQERIYSSNIDYITEEMQESTLKEKGIFTESVDGNQVKTSESFLSMIRQLENVIKKYAANVVNTTIGGAKIEGSTFKTLKQVIVDDLAVSGSYDFPLYKIEQKKKYDCKYAITQLDSLKSEYKVYLNLLTEIKNGLIDLSELTRINQEHGAYKAHLKLDEKIRQMENNAFFKMIALPINRIEYGMLCTEIQKIKAERNYLKKAKSIIKPTETVINLLYTDMALNNEIMLVLENVVKGFA
ncbi:MAG: hypothetical protein PWP52_1119 [Bacteroidales bacterium]|jgi:hypothetical protein|nr:hypothetical protein [Bacteroidales bacterium]